MNPVRASDSDPTPPAPPRPCRPPAWARSGHVQTLLGRLSTATGADPMSPGPGFERSLVPMRDGDQLVVYMRRGARPVAVHLLHGLGGSTASGYLRHTAQTLAAADYTVLAVNHRGSGDAQDVHSLPYQTGRIADLEDLLEHGRDLLPAARHAFIGFSLSGNTLLKSLALSPVVPDAAIAVNPPIDLDSTSRHILRGVRRLYDFVILQSCRRWVPYLRGRGPDRPRYRVPVFSSLREFDRLYIAPVSGFPSREEYYRTASSRAVLARITTPTVILSSRDDPIVDCAELERAPWSPSTALHLERHGGHLGFFGAGSTQPGGRWWLPYALEHYLGLLLGGEHPRA